MTDDILTRLVSLSKQAIMEKSHYYVAATCLEAIKEIERLRGPNVPSKAQEDVKEKILAERAKGNVVFMGIEGLMAAPLEEFVKQPADGILYDLNRLEEICLTFIAEKKWVNDFACAMVIRKLIEQRDAAVNGIPATHGEGPK